ncbi:MAG: J domain-containing protein [Pyrinomonadaceae bacterium]
MVNYYKILKVAPQATTAEIKSAYRRLARELHPDINNDSENAAKDFALIVKAYEILSDPQERAYFDKKLLKAQAKGSIHNTDSVFYSDNPHARRLRQMAFERRYNAIIDQMIDSDRSETLALQRVIFPTVALFVSTCVVAIFRPLLWTNARIGGKIILLTLFIFGVFHLVKRLRSGFQKFTYDSESLHDSIFDEIEPESKPYSRVSAVMFLVVGIGISLGIGLLIGNFMELSIMTMMPKLFSKTLQPEFIFYPPIVVLLVDLMHSFALKMDN